MVTLVDGMVGFVMEVVVLMVHMSDELTASGQWLIENRPGQIKKKMSDRFSNISFSKDSETGDIFFFI